MTDPTEIEKIVLEVLEKKMIPYEYFDEQPNVVLRGDFPNVAREVAERITNENR